MKLNLGGNLNFIISKFLLDYSSIKGITMIEILITSTILGLFSITLFLIHAHFNKYSKTTFWKQEKMKQLDIFIRKLQKALEEATDELQKETLSSGNWRITKNKRPLLYISSPDRSGKIMAWRKDRLDIQTGVKETKTSYVFYDKENRKLRLVSDESSLNFELSDVEKIVIKAIPIKQLTASVNVEDLYKEGIDISNPSAEETGSLIEVYFYLSPNDSRIPKDVKVEQNAKFKLIISALESSNPSY